MTGTEGQFEVISNYNEVSGFLEKICKASDEHRNALGFYGRGVFDEFARKSNLLVLIKKNFNRSEYIGHLLYSTSYPRANILQMFVRNEYRRSGLASMLLNNFRHTLTRSGFLSIYARVAEDLVGSNEFWNQQGFYVQRVEKGGVTKNRKILVLCHELNSPQLFPPSGITDVNPLGLAMPAIRVPLYLLDLNVLFDLGPTSFAGQFT